MAIGLLLDSTSLSLPSILLARWSRSVLAAFRGERVLRVRRVFTPCRYNKGNWNTVWLK